jgi:predicted nucleic acid-binding Zn finger protein
MPLSSQHDILATDLPGPDRKRSPSQYLYRVTYRQDEEGAGCVLLLEVTGGRMPYQIALERDDAGNLQVHCTCADAIFRAEAEGRFCKHVHGLVEFMRPTCAMVEEAAGVVRRSA